MKLKDLKWYSPFLFLAGAILGVADPITDILTVVEFYRNDHKILFEVGLLFVILPCLPFVFLVSVKETNGGSPEEEVELGLCCTRTIAFGLHPFAAAFARLQGFVFSLKRWCRGDNGNDDKGEELLEHINMLVLFESVLESAPQFIIQLYAINAQAQPVQIIQMISLPVSFLSLNWAFVIIDGMIWFNKGQFTLRRKIFIFVAEFLLLSSRLFAVCYFTVTLKWWVIGVLLFHTFVIVMANFVFCLKGNCNAGDVAAESILWSLHWLRDDVFTQEGNSYRHLLAALLSNVLFVIENVVMILVFYFSQHSNSWFSLPVTVCVCSFSVLGSTMKIAGLYAFLRQQERA
ncbi:XK-related protein 9-like [Acropora millepora]|uniref:XK-related protein 9-like n=1 Tax=Acropora millepora TaxID=45264 RepID=UPI001CF108B5|nr:XK-related protein 9-like [Acropora millepora]